MRICRFDDDRLGVVNGDQVFDVSAALDVVPSHRWPIPLGDPLVLNLQPLLARIAEVLPSAPHLPVASVALRSPIANPSKVMAAPANYRKHVEIDSKDPEVDSGVHHAQLSAMDAPTEELGLFLKANSSIVGGGDGICIAAAGRRSDHEVELAVVIGTQGKDIRQADALSHVAGYCLGLDMTIRGKEDRSFRKSADGYTVLGPWLVTADEIPDPGSVDIRLAINGVERQSSNTAALTVGIERMIEMASSMYTLYPGDVLLTGTPEGVGQVVAGDVIEAGSDLIGSLTISVR